MSRNTLLVRLLSVAAAAVLCLAVFPSGALASAACPAEPPCNFMTADFTGADAPVLEKLFGKWGFLYESPDSKWTDADAYELRLFQRWAKLKPSGTADDATRRALLSAYRQYGETVIPRQKLKLEGRYIGINAGHQGKADSAKEKLSPEAKSPLKQKGSSGTQGRYTRVPEYKVNLAVALKLQARLEALGARVLMVRTTNNVRISNGERARTMSDAGVDLMLSLHCDGNRRKTVYGLHTLIPAQRGNQQGDVLKKSQLLARKIQAAAVKTTGARNKGFSTRRDLTSFNWSSVPTCLVEMGYMTNKAEDKKLVTSAYQDKLAMGFVNGITAYFQEAG
jgi:N-acetylmuramoyl-L-alanine amidase